MRWLYCEFADAGRAPMSAMFLCDDDSIGYAYSGMAKLNDTVGWSCSYHDLSLGGEYERGGKIAKDSVMLTTWFEPGKCVANPTTGEPVLPPICHTAICRAAYEGDVIAAFSRLFRSRGWVGETKATRLMA